MTPKTDYAFSPFIFKEKLRLIPWKNLELFSFSVYIS